jgi:acyl carrier protein
MDLDNFVTNFSDQFEDTDVLEFSPTTEFKNLDEWSSLLALSIIAMVDEEYGVTLKGDDIKEANTIEELYNIVSTKK